MINKQLLISIGMTSSEADIYEILLNLREGTAGRIAQNAKIARPNVYDSLNKLLEKNLISYVIKSGARVYKVADVSRLLEYVNEQKENILSNIQSLIKEVSLIQKESKPAKETEVEIFEGKESFVTILNDIIKTKKELLVFNTYGKEFLKYVPKYLIKKYLNERKKNKIFSRQFYYENAEIYNHPMVKFKVLPKDSQIPKPISIDIYGDNVAIMMLVDPPLAIRIKNKDIAEAYKKHFELLWNLSK